VENRAEIRGPPAGGELIAEDSRIVGVLSNTLNAHWRARSRSTTRSSPDLDEGITQVDADRPSLPQPCRSDRRIRAGSGRRSGIGVGRMFTVVTNNPNLRKS
jgi:hypothetical protein